MHNTYPSPAELPVLRALWALGTATHAEVLRHLGSAGLVYRSNAPTQMLRSLVEKGYVAREPAPSGTRGHVYAARVGTAEMAAMIVEGL